MVYPGRAIMWSVRQIFFKKERKMRDVKADATGSNVAAFSTITLGRAYVYCCRRRHQFSLHLYFYVLCANGFWTLAAVIKSSLWRKCRKNVRFSLRKTL